MINTQILLIILFIVYLCVDIVSYNRIRLQFIPNQQYNNNNNKTSKNNAKLLVNVRQRDKIQIKFDPFTFRFYDIFKNEQKERNTNLSMIQKQLDQHLVIMIQKYKQIKPSSLHNLISRCTPKQQVTWQHLLAYMEQQIQLEDLVNKMKLSKPSIIDVAYYPNPDEHLDQKINDVIHYIKKKSTNYIKFITKAEFLGYKLLIIVLQKQTIFYQCNDKVILKCLNFKYNNVRSKIMSSYQHKQKSSDNKLSKIFKKGSEVVTFKYSNQQNDKVYPISRRTDQNIGSPSLKSRKNTNQTDQLKNILGYNIRNSKMGESVSVCSDGFDHNIQNVEQTRGRRTTTMMDYQSVALLNRSLTKHSKKKDPSVKKQYLKIRSNDTGTILKLVTDSKIQGSIQAIKAYKNSIQTFQKYVQIDKSKVQKQRELLDEIKLPSGLNMKFDYKKSIKQMKNKGKQLEQKKRILQKGDHTKSGGKYNFNQSSYRSKKLKTEVKSRPKSKFVETSYEEQKKQQANQQQSASTNVFKFNNQNESDAFVALQKRVLQIQSVSFYQNYMLISLMNCQLRLYSFKKSIHGFSQQLIFQKNYSTVISYVQIYKSLVRKLCNICVVLSKFSVEGGHGSSNIASQKNTSNLMGNNMNIRATNMGFPKKDTEILVYQLSSDMKIQKQVYSTFLSYSPIIINMIPLGIGGYIQSGYFFLVQLNCTTRVKSELKAIDTSLNDPQSGKKVSISCMKCHKNLVNLFIGCKNGEVYVYDRLAENVRIKNKISNHQILEINFVNDGNQILFWDYSGKVGIFNADTLTVSHVSSIISEPISDSIGSNRRLWGLTQFFIENQFLIYGDRVIELISLNQNTEKKFKIQKPMKIYNRRFSIKNRHLQQSIQQKQTVTAQPVSMAAPKKIHNYFKTSQSLIMVTCQGQILIYDKNVTYIGSYFTLNYGTLTQCLSCPSIKYLYLLYQNNDMQVVNIYTQQQLISITNVRQQVYDIFFCHSSVYFCGYLSSRKFQLRIYAYPNQNFSTSNKNLMNNQPIITVKLYNLIMDIPETNTNNQSKLSKISKYTESSVGSLGGLSKNIEIQIKFYKGSMIIIDFKKSQILFLYKKSYTRNCVIKCQQYCKYQSKQSQIQFSKDQNGFCFIINTCIDLEAGKLTLLMSNYILIKINLDNKVVTHIYQLPVNRLLLNISQSNSKKQKEKLFKIDKQNQKSNKSSKLGTPLNQKQPIAKLQLMEHYFQPSQNIINIIWKITKQPIDGHQDKQGKYIYTVLNCIISQQQQNQFVRKPNFIHIIKAEPNPHLHPHMHHQHHTSTHFHQKKLNAQKISNQQWISCPFLIGHSLLTMNEEQTYFNLYRIRKGDKQKSYNKFKQSNKQSQLIQSKNRKYSQISVQNQTQVEYFRIEPE